MKKIILSIVALVFSLNIFAQTFPVSGTVTYTGTLNVGKPLIVGLVDPITQNIVAQQVLVAATGNQAYSVDAPLGTYFLGAFIDMDNDGVMTDGVDIGTLNTSEFVAVTGTPLTGQDITVNDEFYNITGSISYFGSFTSAKLKVAYCTDINNIQGTTDWLKIETINTPSYPQAYSVEAPNGDYYVYAFIDKNDDGQYTDGEPFMINVSATNVAGADATGVDLTLPGVVSIDEVSSDNVTAKIVNGELSIKGLDIAQEVKLYSLAGDLLLNTESTTAFVNVVKGNVYVLTVGDKVIKLIAE